jgi:hypothetical protein
VRAIALIATPCLLYARQCRIIDNFQATALQIAIYRPNADVLLTIP